MSSDTRTLKELKQEADELGITYSPNIGKEKLATKIEEFYQQRETSVITPKDVEEAPSTASTGWTDQDRRKLALEREKRARSTKVIEIIDNDQRVNNQTTSVTVTCSNTNFDLGTVVLPLNTPVEVMQGHIDVLKSIEIPQHVRDKDGLSTVKMRKRYTINVLDKEDLKK